jgi:hypothetical protein
VDFFLNTKMQWGGGGGGGGALVVASIVRSIKLISWLLEVALSRVIA